MKQHFHWRGLDRDVQLFVAQCDACQRRKLVLAQVLACALVLACLSSM
jgi:hypothetical protein